MGRKTCQGPYKLSKAESPNSDSVYYVMTHNGHLDYPLSRWTKQQNLAEDRKPTSYMSIVLRFLNFLYLTKKGKHYSQATNKDIRDFFITVTELDENGEVLIESRVQTTTIEHYRAALTNFYKHLTDFYDHGLIRHIDWSTNNGDAIIITHELKTSWNDIGVQAQVIIRSLNGREKVNDKAYIKEYTDEELAALFRSFKKPVQKAIFILTLKGLRIDEALSIKLRDYNPKTMTVQPSRSKGHGRRKGNIRTVLIGPLGIQMIEDYLLHQRQPALAAIQKEGREDCGYLMVTTQPKNNVIPFTPYTQSSFRSALIKAAKRAGIDKKVKTHGGRSHCAIGLTRLEHQGIITDEQLRLIMGWRSINAHEPYDGHVHKEEAEKTLQRVEMQRNARLEALIKQMEEDK